MRAVLLASAAAATFGWDRSASAVSQVLNRSVLPFDSRITERAPWISSVR